MNEEKQELIDELNKAKECIKRITDIKQIELANAAIEIAEKCLKNPSTSNRDKAFERYGDAWGVKYTATHGEKYIMMKFSWSLILRTQKRK